jgi:hypothetical protein
VGLAVLALFVSDALAFRTISNRARPVSLATVVARFREQSAAIPTPVSIPTTTPVAAVLPTTPAAATTRPTAVRPASTAKAPVVGLIAPAAGVYVYATSGGETTNAVGGAHHEYPAETTITVTATPCGFAMRWDGLQQRWDEWNACVTGHSLVVTDERMKHAFYGVNDERQYECSNAILRPGSDATGTPVSGRCARSGSVGEWSGGVVGPDTINVAGKPVAAIHIRLQELMSGDTQGVRRSEDWFEVGSGLLLRRLVTVEGDSSTAAGRVHYSESVTLQLASLVPQS